MCSVGAGSVPRVGQAFGVGAGSRGLAGRQAVKRAAAPTGIVHALDAKRILRYAGLGGSRNVIDRPDSCCSEHRGEGYTDHFSAPSWLEGGFSFEPWATAWAGRAGDGTSLPDPVQSLLGEQIKNGQHQIGCSISLSSPPHRRFWIKIIRSSIVRYANSASCRRICNGLLSAVLSATKQDGPTPRPIRRQLKTSHVRFEAVAN